MTPTDARISYNSDVPAGKMLSHLRGGRPRSVKLFAAPGQRRLLICSAASRRALLRRVRFALKPASKALGLHGVFIRG
jgi:hypothetical protein